MALITCPECQQQVSTLAATCPHCGAPRTPEAPPRQTVDQEKMAAGVPIEGSPSRGGRSTRKSYGCVVAILFVVGLVLLLAFISSQSSRPVTSGSTAGTYSVWYYVEGTRRGGEPSTYGTVSVTYVNAQGGTEQETEASLPWAKRVADVRPGTFLYLTAQHRNPDNYGITVRIVDAKTDNELKRSESKGLYAGATASAQCC